MYGYRPIKSAVDAVGRVQQMCWAYDWAYGLHIKSFLDTSGWLKVLALSGNGVAVLLGTGDGAFHAPDTFATSSIPYFNAPVPVIAADLNGDGLPDLLAGSSNYPGILALIQVK